MYIALPGSDRFILQSKHHVGTDNQACKLSTNLEKNFKLRIPGFNLVLFTLFGADRQRLVRCTTAPAALSAYFIYLFHFANGIPLLAT